MSSMARPKGTFKPDTSRPPRVCECGAVGFAQLQAGLIAICDPEDVPLLGGVTWSASTLGRNSYAHRWVRLPDGTKVNVRMHRVICPPAAGEVIDHLNGDGLDNRRSNLRSSTHALNIHRSRRAGKISGFKGVSRTRGGKWEARLKFGQVRLRKGPFATASEAAKAYDDLATANIGEHAGTNASMGLL